MLIVYSIYREISFQAKKINSGKPVEFEKLDVTVAVESSEPVSPMILLYRTPADAENMEIPVHGLEEILRYLSCP